MEVRNIDLEFGDLGIGEYFSRVGDGTLWQKVMSTDSVSYNAVSVEGDTMSLGDCVKVYRQIVEAKVEIIEILFKDIKVGETFIVKADVEDYEDSEVCAYMKLTNNKAVEIHSGEIVTVEDNDVIEPCNAYLQVSNVI